MTSRVRWIATLLTGFGIVGFVIFNYQDPWPPLVPRPLDPDEVAPPLFPQGAYSLEERAAPDTTTDAEPIPSEDFSNRAPQPSPPTTTAAPPAPMPAAETEKVFAAATRLLESADFEPLYVDGALLGVRFGAVERESFLARAGLQSGDVVRTVNDLRLDDPTAAAVLAQQIGEGIPLDVAVERKDGTTVRLSIPVLGLLGGTN